MMERRKLDRQRSEVLIVGFQRRTIYSSAELVLSVRYGTATTRGA